MKQLKSTSERATQSGLKTRLPERTFLPGGFGHTLLVRGVTALATLTIHACNNEGGPAPFAIVDERNWLDGPSQWSHAVDLSDGCPISEATNLDAWWPGFAWTSCGVGCSIAPVLPGPQPWQLLNATVAPRWRGDTLLLTMSAFLTGARMTGVFAFGAGEPQAQALVAGFSTDCSMAVAGPESPFLLSQGSLNSDLQYAWFDANATPPRFGWLPPQAPLTDAFDFGTGWGAAFDGSSIRLTRDPKSLELHEVYNSDSLLLMPAGDGGEIFFAEGDASSARIVAVDASDQLVELGTGNFRPVALGVSPDRIVWAATDAAPLPRTSPATSILSCPRTTPISSCNELVRLDLPPGIVTPDSAFDRHISVSGAWLALNTYGRSARPYLVNSASGEVYQLNSPTAEPWLEVIAITNHEVIAVPGERRTHFVRIDLSEIARYATRQ